MKKAPKIPWNQYLSSQIKLFTNPLKAFEEYSQQLGSIYRYPIGSKEAYVITDPEIVKHILITHTKNYRKAQATQILGEVIGNGLLTSEGDYWLKQRRFIQPGFHREQYQKLVNIMIDAMAGSMSEIEKELGNNLNVTAWSNRVSLNIISKSLFSQGITYEQVAEIEQSINFLSQYVVTKVRNPLKLLWLKLTGGLNFYREQTKSLDSIVYQIIQNRKTKSQDYNDLLAMMMNIVEEDTNKPAFSDKQLRDESLILFLAGHETSANAISWLLYTLTQNPTIQSKIGQEIAEIVGNNPINLEILNKLQYTEQVIQEALRMYPPAWVMSRESLEPDLLKEYQIPKGAYLYIFIYGIQNSLKYWQNAQLFDPERFNSQAEKPKEFTFFPFGGGQRFCIGNQFALLEIKLVLVKLLQLYKIEYINSQAPEKKALITLRSKEPIYIKFSPK
jgi:cytochrome P450